MTSNGITAIYVGTGPSSTLHGGNSSGGVCMYYTGFQTASAPIVPPQHALPVPINGWSISMHATGFANMPVSYDIASVNFNGTRDNIDVSADGGTTWTSLYVSPSLTYSTWTTRSGIALPASCNNNPNVVLLFYGSNSTTSNNPSTDGLLFDNFQVTANSTVPGSGNLTLCDNIDIYEGYLSQLNGSGSVFIYDNFTATGTGTTVNMKYNLCLSGKLYVTNGVTFNFNNAAAPSYSYSGTAGSILTGTGGVLGITDNNGVVASGASGNWQSTGTRTFGTTGGYTFMGGAGKASGAGMPSTVYSLGVNNSSGVALTNPTTVSNTLTLTNGLLNLGSNNITLTTGATVTGSPSSSAMVRADGSGQFFYNFPTGASSFTYPVGDVGPDYVPATLSFATNATAGTVGCSC